MIKNMYKKILQKKFSLTQANNKSSVSTNYKATTKVKRQK